MHDGLWAVSLIATLTTILAVVYRFGHGLTVDEPFMANTARLPWRELWRVFPVDNLPFAYVLLKVWSGLLGESEIALRSLSAVAYGAAVWFTGRAAGRTAGPAGAIVAAMLLAASDRIGLEHAATARPYALLACIAAATLLQSVRMPDRRTRSWRAPALLAVTHLLGMLTHPSYTVFAAACAASALITGRRLRSALCAAPMLALIAYAICWGPMVLGTMRLQTTSWMRAPTAAGVEHAYMLLWGVGPGFMILGALVFAAGSSWRRSRRALGDPRVSWVCVTAGLAWTLAIGVSLWKPIFEPTRTPVMLLPATSLAIATILVRLGRRGPALALAAICAVAAAARIIALPGGDPYPTRASLSSLLARMQCGDTLVAPGLAPGPVEYYLRRLNAPSCIETVPFPRSIVNWTGQLRDPVLRQGLAAEAARSAADIASRGGSAWLLRLNRGEIAEASDMMEAALRQVMVCHEQEPLRGAFFEGMVRCDGRPPPPRAAASPDVLFPAARRTQSTEVVQAPARDRAAATAIPRIVTRLTAPPTSRLRGRKRQTTV